MTFDLNEKCETTLYKLHASEPFSGIAIIRNGQSRIIESRGLIRYKTFEELYDKRTKRKHNPSMKLTLPEGVSN